MKLKCVCLSTHLNRQRSGRSLSYLYVCGLADLQIAIAGAYLTEAVQAVVVCLHAIAALTVRYTYENGAARCFVPLQWQGKVIYETAGVGTIDHSALFNLSFSFRQVFSITIYTVFPIGHYGSPHRLMLLLMLCT